jgi:hypothetical protein
MNINPFLDVQDAPIDIQTGKIAGAPYLANADSIAIGAGTTGFRAAKGKGIWLGAKAFADAPFSVDMDGNLVANSGVFGDVLTKSGADQDLTGGIRVSGTIIVYDSGTPSIIIGSI